MSTSTKSVQHLYGLEFRESIRPWQLWSISFCGVRFTDLDLADDAVVFAESLDSLVTTLEALSRESAALGLQVS